ncbi:MAG: S8 family serine peptidase [Actinomycetota bacterium]
MAVAAWPGSDPAESVRINTPNDPDFDQCEPHEAGEGTQTCTNTFGQQFARFGFAPDNSQSSATYKNDSCQLAVSVATLTLCGDPHTRRLIEQNLTAGRNGPGQVSGVSADRAWKYSTGDPSVQIAILDTGIRWDKGSLRLRVHLNRGELSAPRGTCTGGDPYDCNNDGQFNIADYAGDPRVSPTTGGASSPGGTEGDGFLDPSDLIADPDFADDVDSEGNGYVDDIAGWDFFDDDNDPYDASSYSSANNHGSGRAEDAAAEGNDSSGGLGTCPGCQVVPMRVWDTFVVDTNNFGQAVTYAADNDFEVVEGAVGGLFNSSFDREAFAYAYENGTLPVLVSSDLNTADHNYPTNYNEALHVQGTVADAHGLGEDCPGPTAFCDFFTDAGIPFNAQVGTWFRNSGLTQYGGHAHIVMPADTGSQATGQAAGAAGLVASMGLEKGTPLEPNEIKQVLTLTAEDVKPENTPGTGIPDPSQVGWDQHFGYGRPDLGLAMERVDEGKIPPQALITAPDWFAPLNLSRQTTVAVSGAISARYANSYDWKLQWAPGIEPCEADFQDFATGSGTSETSGDLGTLDLVAVRAALDSRVLSSSCGNAPAPVTGGSTPDATAPSKGPGDVDPNEPAFTVRLVVTDDEGNRGEDRKVLFDYSDSTLHDGASRPIGGQQNASGRAATGGEASQRLFDLDGDNRLDIVEADSSGQLHVLQADGTPLPSFNSGQPVTTDVYPNVHSGAPYLNELDPPREVLRTPAIGDIDGDMEPEIVDAAGEHVYAWNTDGSLEFKVRLDPALSQPADRTRANHIKRGFSGSPALADLTGDGQLDIVESALDEHLYAWDGSGTPLPGFPVKLRVGPCSDAFPCAESVNSPAVGDIAGDSKPEIVVPTNEIESADPGPEDLADAFNQGLINALTGAVGGTGRVYAVHADGNGHAGGPFVGGWPIKPGGVAPDALPFAGPGIDPALGNIDGDPALEVIGSITSGTVFATNGNGSNAVNYDPSASSADITDKSAALGLFEYPVLADLDGLPGLEVLKGGFTTNQLANLVVVGQNLPYNHVLSAWNGQTGARLPAYPQAVEDYQLLSSPAVSDVSSAPGAEAIVGTGLYLLRNINAQGVEGSGWPKFTGGWNFAVPGIGDVDGDGKLEVSSLTREGFSFLWDTDQPACGTNDQWWTSRHDEFGTGNYNTDSRPPGTPTELTATPTANGLDLSWKQPGDDWLCGTATRFRVLASATPIEHPTDGLQLLEDDVTGAAGSTETASLPGAARYLAVLYRDEAGNWGHLASIDLLAQPPGGGGSSDTGGGQGEQLKPGGCANVKGGTSGPDDLKGTSKGDTIRGFAGDDRISGRRGKDCLAGGRGDDRIKGGFGRDKIKGGRGDDVIYAASQGRDRVKCGAGDDVAFVHAGDTVARCESIHRP